jgi:SAM-dependent methyltransferase
MAMLDFDRTISPDDHMLTADLESYFRTAQSGIDCILASLAAAGKNTDDIRSVLDFGSGYGRVYRALAAAFPDAQRTACDLMEPAARFCAETFGGDWLKSDENLDNVALPRRYDLVWLGSVFTHLPSYRWVRLLNFLASATNANGIVVFTTHGWKAIGHLENFTLKRNPYILDASRFEGMKDSLQFTGFDYIPNKPKVIDHQNARGITVSQNEYGISFSEEWWVRTLIEKMPEWRLIRYAAPGWGGNHDAATLIRN